MSLPIPIRATFLAALAVLALSLAGGCGSTKSDALPGKDKTFTKTRGPNTGADDGEDTSGQCSSDETGKGAAACYGNVLLHCAADGAVHAVDCTKPHLGLTMNKCVETDTTADCE